MSVKDTNRIKRLSGIFILTLFVFYYSGLTFFPLAHTHEHSTLVHSHPYKKDSNGNANHTHTQAEFVLIAGLSHLLVTAVAFTTLVMALLNLFCWEIGSDSFNNKLLGAFKELFNLRSPPSPSFL